MDFQSWLHDLPKELFYTVIGAILLGFVGFIWRREQQKREKSRSDLRKKQIEAEQLDNSKSQAAAVITAVGMFMLESSQFIKFAEIISNRSKAEFFPDLQCVELYSSSQSVPDCIISINEAISALMPILNSFDHASFGSEVVNIKSDLQVCVSKFSQLAAYFEDTKIFTAFLIPNDFLTRSGIGSQAADIIVALRRIPVMIYMCAETRKYVSESVFRSHIEHLWNLPHLDDISFDDLGI